jgi:hypothetical protein
MPFRRTPPAHGVRRVTLARMDTTERLRAWGATHAQARKAETAAQQSNDSDEAGRLWREAETLRQEADRLHRDIYSSLGRRDDGDKPR